MGRILALDLGKKRCGVAVTDPLQIIANGLTTLSPAELEKFLADYMARETVDKIIVGYPIDMKGNKSESTRYIDPIVGRLRKVFPTVPFEFADERFTSTLAHRSMLESGMRKSQRQVKSNADLIAATIILNDYLENRKIHTQ